MLSPFISHPIPGGGPSDPSETETPSELSEPLPIVLGGGISGHPGGGGATCVGGGGGPLANTPRVVNTVSLSISSGLLGGGIVGGRL